MPHVEEAESVEKEATSPGVTPCNQPKQTMPDPTTAKSKGRMRTMFSKLKPDLDLITLILMMKFVY